MNNPNCQHQLQNLRVDALVTLNRGYSKPRKNGDKGIKDPDFYIMPVSYVLEVRDRSNEWGKIVKSRLTGIGQFEDRWDLISDFLSRKKP